MEDENSDASLESLLRGMPLREPGAALDNRVKSELIKYRFRQPKRTGWYRTALAAGLLIAVGIGIQIERMKKASLPIVATVIKTGAIEIERDTSTVYDEGIIAGVDDSAYQKFRRRTVREIWYIDPSTHARSLVTIPTEQVIIQKLEAF